MANPFETTEQVNAVIRVRRGKESDRINNNYDVGELVYSTDKKRLFIGDGSESGSTTGGIVVGNKVWVTNNFSIGLGQIQKNDLVYRTDTNKFYILSGSNVLEESSYIVLNASAITTTNNNTTTYTLKPATENALGGLIVGDGLNVEANGYVSVRVDNNTIKLVNGKLVATIPTINNGTNSNSNVKATDVGYGIVRVPTDSGISIKDGDIKVNLDNSTIKLSSTIEGSKLYVDSSNLKYTIANSNTLGVVKISEGLSASDVGELAVIPATNSTIGGLKLGNGLSAREDDPSIVDVLPASKSLLGGIILGDGLRVNDETGKVDVIGGGVVGGGGEGYSATPIVTQIFGDGATQTYQIGGYTNDDPRNYCVVINGTILIPNGSDYTIAAGDITFNVSPEDGAKGFVLAYQAPPVGSLYGFTSAKEVDIAFKGNELGVLEIGTNHYNDFVTYYPKVNNCNAEIVNSSTIRLSGWVSNTNLNLSVSTTSGSNVLSGEFTPLIRSLNGGHILYLPDINQQTQLVSVTDTLMTVVSAISATGVYTNLSLRGLYENYTTYNTDPKPLYLNGLVTGTFQPLSVNSLSGTVDLFCKSNLQSGTSGFVTVQEPYFKTVSLGTGMMSATPKDSVLLGYNSKVHTPQNRLFNYNNNLIAIGKESESTNNGVALGAYAKSNINGSIAIGANSIAGDEDTENPPCDTLFCTGSANTNTLSAVIGDTLGMYVGMTIMGNGLTGNPVINSIIDNKTFTIDKLISKNLVKTDGLNINHSLKDSFNVATTKDSPVVTVTSLKNDMDIKTNSISITANDFTVESWIYLNSLPTSDTWPADMAKFAIIVCVHTNQTTDGWFFTIGKTKLLFSNNNNGIAATTTHGFLINKWYHVACSRVGNVYNLYIDGVRKVSTTYTTNAPGSGAYTWIGANEFDGYISNLRIVKGTALYTGTTLTMPTAPLESVAGTELLYFNDTKFKDPSVQPNVNIGDYIYGTGIRSYARIREIFRSKDLKKNFIVLTSTATAAAASVAVTVRKPNRRLRPVQKITFTKDNLVATVATTATLRNGDTFKLYDSNGLYLDSGKVIKIVNATTFISNYYQSTVTSLVAYAIFDKYLSSLAIGKDAFAGSSEIGLGNYLTTTTTGTIDSYLRINVGGRDFLVPLNEPA